MLMYIKCLSYCVCIWAQMCYAQCVCKVDPNADNMRDRTEVQHKASILLWLLEKSRN